MSWLADPRPSFTHVSTHQTHVGKALYEHAPDCATIATVACMSSSLLKSSLGPNLLALIWIEHETIDLFDKIFLEYNPHMQLTQKLVVESDADPDDATALIGKLKSNGPLFSSSLLQANINLKCLSLFDGFRSLQSLTLSKIEQCEQLSVLKSLPSLSELKLINSFHADAALFKALGELENNRNFTSLDVSGLWCVSWSSEGFQEDVCERLLSKNRLTKLALPSHFWNLMYEEDQEAFVNAGMTNLVELRSVPASLIRGDGFVNLRILSVGGATDENLVNIGNHCLLLEVVELRGRMTGSFLKDEKLERNAFNHLRELSIDASSFSDCDVGAGCSRFVALERLSISTAFAFDGSCLQYLPNPDRLRSVFISGVKFSINNLHRFVNLEELDLWQVQLSRQDILSFVRFEKFKRIWLSGCGEHVARGELFRILACKLPNLEKLYCFGTEASRWIEEDVEAILIGCNKLRVLMFAFRNDGQKTTRLEKKYPWVLLEGELQKKTTVNQKSGSRRKREE